MNLYYEILTYRTGKPAPALRVCRKTRADLTMLHLARKVWQEDENGVRIIKNRTGNLVNDFISGKEQEMEFIWIKLSAEEC